jgi:hypothetical protein
VALTIALTVLGMRAARRFRRGSSSESHALRARETAAAADRERARLIAACVVYAIVGLPLILRIVPPNGVYGFRVAGTGNAAIWYSANAFLGWALVAAAVCAAVLLITLPARIKPWVMRLAFFAPLCGALIASWLYLQALLDPSRV